MAVEQLPLVAELIEVDLAGAHSGGPVLLLGRSLYGENDGATARRPQQEGVHAQGGARVRILLDDLERRARERHVRLDDDAVRLAEEEQHAVHEHGPLARELRNARGAQARHRGAGAVHPAGHGCLEEPEARERAELRALHGHARGVEAAHVPVLQLSHAPAHVPDALPEAAQLHRELVRLLLHVLAQVLVRPLRARATLALLG
mmetsp:Transcript_12680/g.38026  ORF Transcript_12680/g.38026 Transcript_12680/m.38026 type:complete len:204 (-) Transcript_12680:1157-1768(-)